tara:strand:+ start:628 stop:1083 length:456 start_codon:yes stop_codon:yes gene_type:complete
MADKPRAKARRAAALTRPVKLLDDPSKMTPADRIRYYLGLPQNYPMNPELAKKAQARLMRDVPYGPADHRGPEPSQFESLLWYDLEDAVAETSGVGSGLPAHDMYGGSRWLGFRDPGETVSQARARARQAAAKRPHNPRTGPVKRKHGGGY